MYHVVSWYQYYEFLFSRNCEQVIPYGSSKYYNDGPSEEIYNYDNRLNICQAIAYIY